MIFHFLILEFRQLNLKFSTQSGLSLFLKRYVQLDFGPTLVNLMTPFKNIMTSSKHFPKNFALLSWTKTTPNFKSIAISDDDIVGVDQMVHPRVFRALKSPGRIGLWIYGIEKIANLKEKLIANWINPSKPDVIFGVLSVTVGSLTWLRFIFCSKSFNNFYAILLLLMKASKRRNLCLNCIRLNIWLKEQRRIKNPVKHLRWSFLQK